MAISNKDADAMWAASGLPAEDIAEWRDLTGHRTTMPHVAVELATAGITPQMVKEARENPLYFTALEVSNNFDQLAEGADAAAFERKIAMRTLLADETARWHEQGLSGALGARQDGISALTLPVDQRRSWTYDRAGALIGVSKQRARKIATGLVNHHSTFQPRPAAQAALTAIAARAGLSVD